MIHHIDYFTKGGTVGKINNAGDWTTAVAAAEALIAKGHINTLEVTDDDGKEVYSYEMTHVPAPGPFYMYI